MSSKSFKRIAAFTAAVFVLVYFGAVACQALNSRACCSEQSKDCLMKTLQETPKTSKVAIVQIEHNELVTLLDNLPQLLLTVSAYIQVESDLPNFVFREKVNHLTLAPPQA